MLTRQETVINPPFAVDGEINVPFTDMLVETGVSMLNTNVRSQIKFVFVVDSKMPTDLSVTRKSFPVGWRRPEVILSAHAARPGALEQHAGSLGRLFPELQGVAEEDVTRVLDRHRNRSE